MGEKDLYINPEHVPSRLQRARINFKIFRTGFFERAVNLMENLPYTRPLAQEILDKHGASIGSFILDKGFGTETFRSNVSEHLAGIQERQVTA